jgi:hypothetical protein
VTALAVATIGVWVVRTAGILLADHDPGFKTVHSVLALMSIGLAGWALRSVAGAESDRRRAPASGTGSPRRP